MKRLSILLVAIFSISAIAEEPFINGEKPTNPECSGESLIIKRINPKTKKCEDLVLKDECELKRVIFGTSEYSMWSKCPEEVPNDNIEVEVLEVDLREKYEQTFIINEVRENLINEKIETFNSPEEDIMETKKIEEELKKQQELDIPNQPFIDEVKEK